MSSENREEDPTSSPEGVQMEVNAHEHQTESVDVAVEHEDVDEVQQAVDRDPAEVLAEKLVAATEMKLEGNTFFKSKTFDAAIAKYSAALACLGEIKGDVETDSDDEDEFEFDGHPEVRTLQISLYLNLSMTYMKQSRWNETISSCDVVLKGDSSNAKALYRRGVSFARKKGWQSAKKDLLAAFKIDPNNKEIRKELAAVKRVLLEAKEKRKDSMSKGFGAIYGDKEKEEKERKRKEAEKLEQQRQRFEAENKKRENLGYNPYQFSEFQEMEAEEAKTKKEEEERKERARQEERRQKRDAERQANAAKEDADEYDDEDLKIMKDTKKMGYCHFNRKLSEQENNLIGSIAPKQVEHSVGEPAKKEKDQHHSQWNEAGTWEEKDTTKWCEAKLKEVLVGAEGAAGGLGDMDGFSEMAKGLEKTNLSNADPSNFSVLGDMVAKMSPISVKTTKVSTIGGDAHMAVVRKTKRHLYDFNAEVEWEAKVDSALPGVENESGSSKRYKGTVKIPELTNGGDVDFNLSYKGKVEEGHKKQLKKALDAMVENLKVKIAGFESDYQSTH